MRKIQNIKLIRICIVFFVLNIFVIGTKVSRADISFTNGKWETTFNCAERSEPTSMSTCDNLGVWGAGDIPFIAAGNKSQVTAAANYGNGAGGNGYRMWYGDGENIETSPVSVVFPGTDKIWVRFYIHYQDGFKFDYDYDSVAWSPQYHKWLYFRSSNNDGWEVFGPSSGNEIRIVQGGSNISTARVGDAVGSNLNWGWKNLFPTNHGIADGSWHYAEAYLDRASNKSRIWIDGDLKAQGGAIGGPWDTFNFLSNMRAPINGAPAYVDVDDMVIYNTTPPNIDSYGNGPIVNIPATFSISNFTTLVSSWLHVGAGNYSDLNSDNIVNTRDLGAMMSKWN